MDDAAACSRAADRLDRAEFFRGPAMCVCGHTADSHSAGTAGDRCDYCPCEDFEESDD